MAKKSLQAWAGRRAGTAGTPAADRVYRGGVGPYMLPTDHKPMLRSPEGFSCAACKYLKRGDEQSTCGNPDYARWNGDEVIRSSAGAGPVPAAELGSYCSDWFEPVE